MPNRVSVPLPILVSLPPVPPFSPPSAITPLSVVSRLLPPSVSCLEPRKKLPPPSIQKTFKPSRVKPDMSKTPPERLMKCAVPASLLSEKVIKLPELAVIVALPAVELS